MLSIEDRSLKSSISIWQPFTIPGFCISGISGDKRKSDAPSGFLQEKGYLSFVSWMAVQCIYSIVWYGHVTCRWRAPLFCTWCIAPKGTKNNLGSVSNLVGGFGCDSTGDHLLEAWEATAHGSCIDCLKHRQKQDVPPSNDYIIFNWNLFSDWLAPICNLQSSLRLVKHWQGNIGSYN